MKYVSSLNAKLIYVFGIHDAAHQGCLKIGEATLEEETDSLGFQPNSRALNEAAKKRINSYIQTVGIAHRLLHTELTISIKDGKVSSFSDNEVHNVLKRSGIQQKVFDLVNKASEWFVTDLETVKHAIKAVKESRQLLNVDQITQGTTPILFRPEQQAAIDQTKSNLFFIASGL